MLNQKRKLLVHRLTHLYSKVAAILLLPLIIAGALTFNYFEKSSKRLQNCPKCHEIRWIIWKRGCYTI